MISIGHCAELSGGELALARLAPALRELGVEVSVLLGEDGPLVEHLSGTPVRIEPLPPALRRSRRAAGLSAVSLEVMAATGIYATHLARIIAREKPDLVHCNTLKAGVYGSLAARLARRRSVWHLRDILSAEQVGSFATSKLLRISARTLPSTVVANSATTAAAAGLTGRAAIVYDGAMAPEGRAAAYREGPLKALMTGRISRWKGQDVAIAAVREARRGGLDVRLTVAGAAMFEDDRAYEHDIKQAAADGVAEGWVAFPGFVDDVAAAYRSHHVAVHASRFPEPFGQVVVEAMSYGLPVIATKGGGPGEILTGIQAELLVEPDQAEPICDRLVRLAGTETWERYSREALRRAADFSIEATAQRLAHVFRGQP